VTRAYVRALLALLTVVTVVITTDVPGFSVQAPVIPLLEDLTVVTAINWPETGDYESVKRVTAVGDRSITISVASQTPVVDDNPLAGLFGAKPAASAKPALRQFNVRRIVLRDDLENAHDYMQSFAEDGPETYPGSTALGISSAVLSELKKTGRTELTIFDRRSVGGALGGLLGGLLGGDAAKELNDSAKVTGTLQLVKGGPPTMTVLVNGTPTPLPVVHARGMLGDLASEFFILDDPANPLSLKYSYGDNHLQVVRIEFPIATTDQAPARTIEKQLASTGKADIYGIYFDFASDRIKDESEPVLAEIAQALADNAAWTLSVDGHTDNIGGDAFNLDLSKRRAAAVRQALVDRHKIGASRLTTNGFGAATPKDTNATLAGRARNRRVELIRQP